MLLAPDFIVRDLGLVSRWHWFLLAVFVLAEGAEYIDLSPLLDGRHRLRLRLEKMKSLAIFLYRNKRHGCPR